MDRILWIIFTKCFLQLSVVTQGQWLKYYLSMTEYLWPHTSVGDSELWLRHDAATRSHVTVDQNATTMKWHKWGKGLGEQCYELWALKLPTPAPSPHPAPHRVKLQLDNNRTLVHLTLPAIAAFTSRLSKTCILSSLTHDDICFPVHSKLLHNTQLCDAIYRRYWSHRIQSRDRI